MADQRDDWGSFYYQGWAQAPTPTAEQASFLEELPPAQPNAGQAQYPGEWEFLYENPHEQPDADHAQLEAGNTEDIEMWESDQEALQAQLDADLEYAQQLNAELNGDLDQAGATTPDPNEDIDFEENPEMFYGVSYKAAEDYNAQYEHQMKKYDNLLKAQADAQKELAALSGSSKQSQHVASAGPSKQDHRASPSRPTKEYRPHSSHYRNGSNSAQSLTNFDTLTIVAEYLKSKKCGECGHTLLLSADSVCQILGKWRTGEPTALSSHLECPKCSAISTCVACRGRNSGEESSIAVQERKVSWCCSGGRVIVLWLLLCGFDERYSECESESRTASASAHGKKGRQGKGKKAQHKGNGVGFGGGYDEAYDHWEVLEDAPALPSTSAPALQAMEVQIPLPNSLTRSRPLRMQPNIIHQSTRV
jgi:hypothetical protein